MTSTTEDGRNRLYETIRHAVALQHWANAAAAREAGDEDAARHFEERAKRAEGEAQ